MFRRLQLGKKLEPMTLLDGHYLISGDGTGFYYFSKVSSPHCQKKTHRNGVEMYCQQMYVAAIVNPDHWEVLPFFPEMITRQAELLAFSGCLEKVRPQTCALGTAAQYLRLVPG